jgi:hypothetical protein
MDLSGLGTDVKLKEKKKRGLSEMSLITIGRQSHPVVHFKCWVPPVLFAAEKSPKCHTKNKWKEIPFSLKTLK